MSLCAQEAVQRVLLRSSAPGLPCTIHLDSGDGISSLEADRHHEACQSLIGHLDVGQGDQGQGPDNSQVFLLEVGAKERDIVQVIPDYEKYIVELSSSIMYLCLFVRK